jgi:hypothetical protein
MIGNERPRKYGFGMSPSDLSYRLAGSRSTVRGRSPLPTNQNKKLEAIPWGHHSPVLACPVPSRLLRPRPRTTAGAAPALAPRPSSPLATSPQRLPQLKRSPNQRSHPQSTKTHGSRYRHISFW